MATKVNIDTALDDLYKLDDLSLWYKAPPYAFKATIGGDTYTFYLPLNPNNITINTQFATNVITTMYGVIEEHSEQRFFDISLQGTTGMSPKYWLPQYDPGIMTTQERGAGRSSFPRNNNLLGGFFQRTQSLIKQTIQKLSSIASSVGIGDDSYISGVADARSGYAAFHNLYRFLLVHKKEIVGNNAGGLFFINYKDNNQYRVVINNFQLIRSADDPMLYNYSISMRGYDMTTSDTKLPTEIYNYENRLKDLGLDGVTNSSMFSKMANGVKDAKSAAMSGLSAIKGFGK